MLRRTQSQISFLSFVALEQFKALAELVPQAAAFVESGERNLEDWKRALELLRLADAKLPLYASCRIGPSSSSLPPCSPLLNAKVCACMHALERSPSGEVLPQNFNFRLRDLRFAGMNGPRCFGRLGR